MIKGWENEERKPLSVRLGEKLHRSPPLKDKIAMSVYRLKAQESRLEDTVRRLQDHDRDLFSKCVAAQIAKDYPRAAMYANECVEIRKMARILLQCQLAIEQVTLRMETIEEFGDVAVMMGPVAGVVRSIKSKIAGVMPEVSYELGQIGESLNSVVMDVGEASDQTYNYATSNDEAQRIIAEASNVAEQRMKEKFPDLPSPNSLSSEKEFGARFSI